MFLSLNMHNNVVACKTLAMLPTLDSEASSMSKLPVLVEEPLSTHSALPAVSVHRRLNATSGCIYLKVLEMRKHSRMNKF